MSKRKTLPPIGTLASRDARQHMTTTQVARELAVTRQTTRRSLDAAGVPYMTLGCQRYYRRDLIDAFVASKTVTPGETE